jgi:serine/threonine-protein kinase
MQPGRIVAGKYLVESELGRGGMGVVYRAEDVRLRRRVALKFLSDALSASPEARARFLREAQTAAAIDHPNVCTVYETGEDEGRAYIAMALVDGCTLKDRIARGALPLGEAIALATQVAEGLAHAHALGIVHRDVKPANILLADGRHVKITDFGLARVGGSGDVTRTGGVVGTPAYMSPEQARGLPTDARTDVWSFGCVVREMLAGRSPFAAAAGPADLHALLDADSEAVTAQRPDVPPRLQAIVDRCLQREARCRYPDASSLLDDLRALTREEAASASSTAKAPRLPSVAVLPFVDMSPDRSQDFFGEGLAEELIHALAGIQGLRVVARTSAFALKDRGLDVREIGRVLDVDSVVEGSVRAAGNRLRVTAQLVGAADGFQLWSQRFDRYAGDIFAIQDELSLSIVEQLKVSFHVEERDALRRRPTRDHEAYNLYLKGLYFVARPRPDLLQSALRCFEAALARDPSFAKAHAGIALVFAMLGNFNFAPPNEVWPKARAAVERALALDDRLPEAHGVAAAVAFWYDWDWAAAGASYDRLLALDPGGAFTHGDHAWFLVNRLRFDEALREIAMAIDLDPLLPLYYAWSVGLHCVAGRPCDALRDFERAKELDPGFGLPYFHAGIAHYLKGEPDKAIEVLRQGVAIAPHPGWAEGMISMIRMRQGDRADVERIVREMAAKRPEVNVSCMALAWVTAVLGDLDGAFQWVEKAIEERDTLVAFVHLYTPMLAPELAADPRYPALLERLKLPVPPSRWSR